MRSTDLGPLLDAISALCWTLHNATTPLPGGDRQIKSPADAVLLSEATDAVSFELHALHPRLPWKQASEMGRTPPFTLYASDDPTKGWERQEISHARVITLNEGGPVTMLAAALLSLSEFVAYPAERGTRPRRKSRWLALDVISSSMLHTLASGSAFVRAVELQLLRREAGPAPAPACTLSDLGDLPTRAAENWGCIEAIDDLLIERTIAAATSGMMQQPPAWDLKIPVGYDLEMRPNSADATDRTPQWCFGPGHARFVNEVLRLRPSATSILLSYLGGRRSSDRSYRPVESPESLDGALEYLNGAPRVKLLWVELLRRDERLRQFVAAELERRTLPEDPADALTPGEQAVFDALDGTCLDAKALAHPNCCNTSEQTVRGHVRAIRKKRTGAIASRAGVGYYRPDAPPDWHALKPKRPKRRIRTT